MREHPHRRQLIEEMHLRRWPGISAPGGVFQIMRVVATQDREQELAQIEAALGADKGTVTAGTRHVSGVLESGLPFAWERHTEGSSITLFAARNHSDEQIVQARQWIAELPGEVVRATHITLVSDEAEAEALLPSLPFSRGELVSSHIAGSLRFWTDFRLHDQAFGRVLVAASGADPITLSRTVQQLQELGNYRNMALLGLPVVRGQWSELDEVEARLGTFAADVSDPSVRDDELLERVSALSLELANLSNEVGYRLDATRAYGELVSERLEDLQPQAIPGFHSLGDFARRRFRPALRTCAAHRDRLGRLTERAADLTALLRARIETRIENQNAQLLESMERRADLQLRLQQLVEGLSIIALTYYGVGLLSYLLHGIEHAVPLPPTSAILALAVPVIMLVTGLGIHHLKKRILKED
ncbi:DUF3422 family protein [Altererythrobacter sp.]|uniref:DUF3422 family protein n=1 Tax=Altererythrobacter sp. TaxID=1872480 RepID=UPI003D038393